MKHLKTYEEKSKNKEIVYTFKTKAISSESPEGKYEYTIHLLQGDPKYTHDYNGLVLSIDKTPGSWYLDTFLEYGSDYDGDLISISGDDWYCTNRKEIMEELNNWLKNEYPYYTKTKKYNI